MEIRYSILAFSRLLASTMLKRHSFWQNGLSSSGAILGHGLAGLPVFGRKFDAHFPVVHFGHGREYRLERSLVVTLPKQPTGKLPADNPPFIG